MAGLGAATGPGRRGLHGQADGLVGEGHALEGDAVLVAGEVAERAGAPEHVLERQRRRLPQAVAHVPPPPQQRQLHGGARRAADARLRGRAEACRRGVGEGSGGRVRAAGTRTCKETKRKAAEQGRGVRCAVTRSW